MSKETEKTPQEVVALIKEDILNDVHSIDNMPFNGLSVGTQFGQNLAMIEALANLVGLAHDKIDKLENELEETYQQLAAQLEDKADKFLIQ